MYAFLRPNLSRSVRIKIHIVLKLNMASDYLVAMLKLAIFWLTSTGFYMEYFSEIVLYHFFKKLIGSHSVTEFYKVVEFGLVPEFN